jgi:UPF0176 protein
MVLNVAAYHFVPIANPAGLRQTLSDRLGGTTLRGTVLVAPEGINLFLAGEAGELRGFLGELRGDTRFAGLVVKESWSATVPFQRLKVKLKREIIAFRRAVSGEAPRVSPAQLRDWLRQGHDDTGRPVLLLDTRNAEEVAYGTFAGAMTLPITDFVDLPDALEPERERLRGATVVSFCTGGVRCEKAAPWLREQGFGDIRQLDGGILGYFEQVGGEGYDGACFVFDERVALTPDLQPIAAAQAGDATR